MVFGASSAFAVATYEYVFDQTSYTASINGTVDVSVYLQETDGTIFKDTGLINAGVKVRFDDSPVPSSPAKVLTTANITNVSDFDQVWPTSAAVPASGYAGLSLGTFGYVYGTETATDVYRIPLGKFTFTAGTVVGQVTHIRATDFSTSLDDTVYYDTSLNPVALDASIQDATATITATATPEPSSVVLLATALAGVLACFWKQRW